MKEWKPFHESVVDEMRRGSSHDLAQIGRLLENTVIPKNHDVIIEAWRVESRRYNLLPGIEERVVSSLLRQKQKVEEAKKEKDEPTPLTMQFAEERLLGGQHPHEENLL